MDFSQASKHWEPWKGLQTLLRLPPHTQYCLCFQFFFLFSLLVYFGFEISFTSSTAFCPYQRPYFLCRAGVGVPCGALTWANRSANSTPVHLDPRNTWSGSWEPGVKVHREDIGVRKRSGRSSLTAVPCFHGCPTDQWEESNPPTPASVGGRPASSEHLCACALLLVG